MTNRYHSLVVVLATDLRTDDAEPLIAAIRQLRGVIDVSGNVADFASYAAKASARRELGDKLWEVLYPKDKP